MLSLLLGFALGGDRARALQLTRVIAWSGAAYAAYGIVAHLVDPTKILWREKEAYLTSLTSTFINRNTAATYFGTVAIIWLLDLCQGVRRLLPESRINWKNLPQFVLIRPPKMLIVSLSMLFLCLTALFMTNSRAGVLLSLLCLGFSFNVYFRKHLSGWGTVTIAALGTAVFIMILVNVMGGGVEARFDIRGAGDEGRIQAYLSTLEMIKDHSWLGTGLGTFEWSFPQYRSGDVSMGGVWDRAHNTLLELASEVGLPLSGLVAGGWILMMVGLGRGIRLGYGGIVTLGAFFAALLATLHSSVDFSLQISGYAIVLFSFLGAGLAQAFASTKYLERNGLKDRGI